MAVHAEPSRVLSTSPLPRPRPLPTTSAAPHGRRPALDGVRGIAIALVVMHHFTQGFASRPEGGFVGVDLFFVLSGYLITGLLLRSRERTGRLGLRTFWLRRARRLLPPLLLVLAVVSWLFHRLGPPEAWPYHRYDALSSLFYTANVHLMANLDPWGWEQHQNLFSHTWSLAVEEQFYLVWPLLLAGLLAVGARVGRLRTPALWACGVLGAGSFLWLAAAYEGGTAGAAYFDTRGRVGQLLAGAALALVLPALRPRVSAVLGDRAGRLWGWLALAGLLGVLVAVGTLDRDRPAYYLGGAAAVTLAAVALVGAVEAAPSGAVARGLGVAPLTALGKISYTLYLIHWPAVAFTPLPDVVTPATALQVEVLRLFLALGFATLSYLLLERPLLAGTLPWLGRSVPRLALAGVVATAATVGVVLSATSLPGSLAAQVRAVPALPCPGQGLTVLAACRLSTGTEHWVVAGDGEGAGLARALATIPHLGVTQAAWQSCGAGGLTSRPTGPPSSLVPVDPRLLCTGETPGLLADAVALPGTTTVLVADATSAQVDLDAGGGRVVPGTDAHDRLVRAALLRLVDQAAGRGVRTVLLRQPPPSPGLAALVEPNSLAGHLGADRALTGWLRRYDAVLASVAAARPAWARVVSVDDLVCPAGSCSAVVDGLLVRHDGQAFAPAFARWIAPSLVDRVRGTATPPPPGG